MTRQNVIPKLTAVCPLPFTVTAAFVLMPTDCHCVERPPMKSLQNDDCDRKQQWHAEWSYVAC